MEKADKAQNVVFCEPKFKGVCVDGKRTRELFRLAI